MSNESERQIQYAISRWENEGGAIPPDDRPDTNDRGDERATSRGRTSSRPKLAAAYLRAVNVELGFATAKSSWSTFRRQYGLVTQFGSGDFDADGWHTDNSDGLDGLYLDR